MKSIRFYAFAAAIASAMGLTVFSSCTNDSLLEEELALGTQPKPATTECLRPVQPSANEDNKTRLVSVYETKSWTLDEFTSMIIKSIVGNVGRIDDNETLKSIADEAVNLYRQKIDADFLHRGWHMEQANFTYRSLTASGDSATFSGCVVFPCADDNSTHFLAGVTIFNPHLFVRDAERPTAMERPVWFRAIYDEAVVTSDGQGFGVSSDMIVPFFDGYAKGIQAVDATMAALEYLKSRNIEVSPFGYTENVGASLGAQQALGVQRYIESADCPMWVKYQLHNMETYASTGPIEPYNILDSYIEKNDSLEYNGIPVYMVLSLFASFPDMVSQYDIADFFESKVSEYRINAGGQDMLFLDGVKNKVVDSGDFNKCFRELYGCHLKKLLAPDMIDSNGKLDLGNEKAVILKTALESFSSVADWIPMNRLLISHSKDDKVLFYDETMKSYFKLNRRNPLMVEFTESYGSHELSTGIGILRMTFMQHPAYHSDVAEHIVSRLVDLLKYCMEHMQ